MSRLKVYDCLLCYSFSFVWKTLEFSVVLLSPINKTHNNRHYHDGYA